LLVITTLALPCRASLAFGCLRCLPPAACCMLSAACSALLSASPLLPLLVSLYYQFSHLPFFVTSALCCPHICSSDQIELETGQRCRILTWTWT
jgi:hypothetical protein